MVAAVSFSPVPQPLYAEGFDALRQVPSPSVQERTTSAAEHVENAAGARLAYDRELRRTFVEFLDPRSGDVLARFPAEELCRHLDALTSLTDQSGLPAGSLINKVA